jgi:putative FmdB family regulatory protein
VPIYEYEPEDRECLICEGRTEVMQGINDEALKFCPTCGLEVRRVVSRATFQLRRGVPSDKAADRGFTTFKRVEKGKWEKVGGEGPDMIVGSEADIAAVEAEKKPAKKVVDLDKS